MVLHDDFAQAVGPGQRRFRDPLFKLRVFHLDARFCVGMNHDMHARVVGTGYLDLGLHAGAAEAFAHDLLDTLAHFGVVPIARHVDQTRPEAVIRITPHQQPHRSTLVKVDHSPCDTDQIVDARLEELIARVGLEYVDHGLAVVAGGVQAKMLDHALDLAAQNRDVARAAVISGGCPQAEEAMLAAHAPAIVEVLHPDIVEIFGAMHGGR